VLPRERVLASLAHREPDLVPWGEHFYDYNVVEDLLGRPTLMHAKMRETRALWEGRRDEVVADYLRDTIDFADAIGFDIITTQLVPEKHAVHTPMEQLEAETYRDKAGNLHRVSSTTHDLMPYQLAPGPPSEPPTLDRIQESIDRVDREGMPKPHDSAWELVRHAVRERKATHFVAVLAGDINWPSFGRTQEEYFMNLALYPELHAKLAEANGKREIACLDWYASEGVDAVIPCGDLGSSTALLASPQIFREHMWPWAKAYCDRAHELGLWVLKHCCGRVMDIIDDLVSAGYDGYEAIQISAGMDLRVLKEHCRGKMTLWSGIMQEHLIGGAPEDIWNDARYALRYAAPGGGYIYGASHSLAVGTSRANLEAMRQAREQLGVYPIRVD